MTQDLKFALMQLRRSPRFHLLAVATLALGIGATTAIFSLVNGVLLRSLPFPQPDRLVALTTIGFPPGLPLGANPAAASYNDNSYPDFFDWRRQSHSFTGIASFTYASTRKFSPKNGEKARIIDGVHVSSGFFETLGVLPEYGRSFIPDDERQGTCSVIISHEFWMSEFGGSINSIGAPIRLSDNPCTVIGVMPAGFNFPYHTSPPQFWRTLAVLDPAVLARRAYRDTNVIARLRDGLKLSQAEADVSSIQRGLASSFPDDLNFGGVAVTPLLENLTGAQRQPLFLLFASVTGVLLIACVNVAGLLLARGVTRKTEFSIRIALGASRGQIIRQVLLESVILSSLGGIVGVALAFVFLRAFLAIVPGDLPRIQNLRIDAVTLLFSLAISLVTGIGFGLFPAWSASRSDTALSLGSSNRSSTRGRHEGRIHSALVIAEIAVSLVLLAGSGLLIRSFVETVRVHPGFDTRNLLTFRLGMSHTKYPPEKALPFFHRVTIALSALPEVQSVTSGYPIPFTYDELSTFRIEGIPYDPTDPLTSKSAIVAPRYFETLEIPLLRGRTFTDRDKAQSARVALVNSEFARRYFPNGDAIGKSIQPHLEDDDSQDWYQVVGIVAGIRTTDLTQTPDPEFFLPLEQRPAWVQSIILRVARNPGSYITPVYSAIAALDPDVPLFDVSSMDDRVTQSTGYERFETQLLTYFALAALLLSAIGLYATLSEMVARRTSEIGLRVALGALPTDIFQLVLKRGLWMATLGVFIGLLGFWIVARSLSDLLYNVSILDPWTIFVSCVVLLSVSLLASVWPAWLAVRLQPLDALREQ